MKRFTALLFALAILISTTAAFAGEWTGTLTKKDGKLWLKSSGNTYSITNPDKATGFEGQNVKVVGTADQAMKSVTITSVTKA